MRRVRINLVSIQANLLDPILESKLCSIGEPLIAGLPDDIALQCLLRVPVSKHVDCRAVCKRWYHLFSSKQQFFTKRKELGLNHPWLFVLVSDNGTSKIHWKVLDLIHLSWHSIPDMPYSGDVWPDGFNSVSVDGVLYVCGGVVPATERPLNLVFKYEVWKNKWTVMKEMCTARSWFACGAVDGMLYAAGGNDADEYELNSAEVFDAKRNTWQAIASMGECLTAYDSVVFNGKLFITEGLRWPVYVLPRGQVYDPGTDKWEDMSVELRKGWLSSGVVIYGKLFVVLEHARLMVYDAETDSWDIVEGPALPGQIRKPFRVSCWECKVYVVGENLHVAVGHITKMQSNSFFWKRWRFRVRWRMVDAPRHLRDLKPGSAEVVCA